MLLAETLSSYADMVADGHSDADLSTEDRRLVAATLRHFDKVGIADVEYGSIEDGAHRRQIILDYLGRDHGRLDTLTDTAYGRLAEIVRNV